MHPLARSQCKACVGQVFNAGDIEYELLGKIGDGAVGVVRKAVPRTSGKMAAVKFLAPDPKYLAVAAFDEVAQRFRREGTRGARLQHQNLVKIIAYEDNTNGECFRRKAVKNPFIVMEYVKGRTLESLVRNLRPASTRRVSFNRQTLTIAYNITLALEYLHSYRVVHRDVKPANVFLSTIAPGQVPSATKLGDFGVTKWGDFRAAYATGSLTVSHQHGLGTIKYMSPEQSVAPKEVTVRSDMFSLGITLFELFTGQILPSPHHIFEIMMERNSRGSVVGKMLRLGVHCTFGEQQQLFALLLDMFLPRPKGRPTSTATLNELASMLDRVSGRSPSDGRGERLGFPA